MRRAMPFKMFRCGAVLELLLAGLLVAAVVAVTLVAPTERTMGHAQRIVYLHVSVAWVGLVSFVVMASTGAVYLVRRDLKWDHWSRSAAELGWLSSGLTLVTGSLWAHAAWGVWWTWDPRLATSFVLWAIYSGILIARGSLSDGHHRARISAALSIVGMLDVPLVVMATRWFRGIHPTSPAMDPTMRVVLLVSVVGFSAFFSLLLVRRRWQLDLEHQLVSIQRSVGGLTE